jgi:hypothetical protein
MRYSGVYWRPMSTRYACLLAAVFCLQAALAAQIPADRPLRIIAFGAHPDDAELKFAGAFLMDGVKQRSADVANQYRDLLVKLYGEQKGRGIRYAEAFELNQYGSPATVDEFKKVFPTFR